MDEKKWNGAGWVAIAAAALMPLQLILGLLADTAFAGRAAGIPVALMASLVGLSSMLLSLIALYRFRELLNERYDFHAIDSLITIFLVAFPIMMIFGALVRLISIVPGVKTAGPLLMLGLALPMILFGVVMGILSILIGVRLLSFEGDLEHLMRPYAILSIIEGACFVLVLLAPLGLILVIADLIVLGLIFFRAGQSQPSVEFV